MSLNSENIAKECEELFQPARKEGYGLCEILQGNGPLIVLFSLAPEVLLQIFRQYRIKEYSTLLAFIELLCIPYHDHCGLLYILSLRNHDNGRGYFIDLRCIVHNTRAFLNSGIQKG